MKVINTYFSGTRLRALCFTITALLLLPACSSTDRPQVRKQELLSRSYTHLTFTKPGQHISLALTVGGEHTNIQKIRVLENQRYQIIITPSNKQMSFYIKGNSLKFSKTITSERMRYEILVLNKNTLIELSQNSHPDTAKYNLSIKRTH